MSGEPARRIFTVFSALLLATATVSVSAELCDEQPADAARIAYCGANAPEDIVLFERSSLLISAMQPARHLFQFDLMSQSLQPLEALLEPLSAEQNWGDPACAAPDELLTHGLDLARRPNGEWQLLVVNHQARESIEFFEVQAPDDDALRLRWRGCVLAADDAQFNDVAALRDGGFLATDPITASMQLPKMILGALGRPTGRVYRWSIGEGYRAIPQTEGAYPNGILLSADGKSFYLNLYLDGEVREHDLETGDVLNRIDVPMPDNSSLTADGQLLVASHDASLVALLMAIASGAEERNAIAYEIVAVDTDSFASRVIFRSEGEDMGGGTIAQRVGKDLYIGAFRGDRMLRVTLDE